MLTCTDVAKGVGQDELTTAPWPRRFALRLHLVMCSYCRRYAAQIRAINATARHLLRERREDPQTLERLRERILGHRYTTHDSGEAER